MIKDVSTPDKLNLAQDKVCSLIKPSVTGKDFLNKTIVHTSPTVDHWNYRTLSSFYTAKGK